MAFKKTMNSEKILLSEPSFEELDAQLITEFLKENNYDSRVNAFQNFEKGICNYVNSSNGIALSSGTSSLHVALLLLGIKQGDTVLCSTFTFAASAFPIKYVGASPIFIDSEIETWNMCPILLENAIVSEIKKEKKPSLILLVHTYGVPAKMNELLAISKKYGIPILEDAAEALGATFQNKHCGTFGALGVYSFNTNKVITTLGGGILVSENKSMIEKANYLSTQAKENKPFYLHNQIGYNYRMNPLAAVLGLAQLKGLDEKISLRREKYQYYQESFKAIHQITMLDELPQTFSNRWVSCILVDSSERKEKIRNALYENGIESRYLWNPLHEQPVFNSEINYLNGVSNELFKKGLILPSSSKMDLTNQKRVVKLIENQF